MSDRIKNKDGRDRIGLILYTVYVLFLVVSVVIICKIFYIQFFFHPNEKIQKALTPRPVEKVSSPVRGNILDCNGNLLAISSPIYQIGMDCTVRKAEFKAVKDKAKGKEREEEWCRKARELSTELAKVFPHKSAGRYYIDIMTARENGIQYMEIGKPVDKLTYERIKTFPLFREGGNKGGLVAKKKDVRIYPYGELARRTIGFVRSNELKDVTNNKVGLEGKYNFTLHGKEGHEWLRKTDFGYVHNFDSTSIMAEDGKDIVTTINIDYQDIADKALREQLKNGEDLEGACLVLMEVSTGAIRAMVNLKNDGRGNYSEGTNYAVGSRIEPGSVFKTVTLMSVLEDRYVKSLDETIETNGGMVRDVRDAHVDEHIREYERKHGNRISILHGFAISSNYVFGTLAVKYYQKNPGKFTRKLISDYHLSDKFDFDLDGLASPNIPTPETMKSWSNSTLNTLGFGYSSELTPLHVLTYYNAIAGKGRMMKPYLVESICENGMVVEKKGPKIINASICRKEVADTLTRALMEVTEDGTAKNAMKGIKCVMAGKTGTSFQTFNVNGHIKYADENGRKGYRGTFVGYFPANDPQYSIICTVFSKPTDKSYQGGGIPARAVRTVVDRLYNIDPYFQPKLSRTK